MAEKTQTSQPRNIFEQIAIGLQITNENTVSIAQDIANLYKMVEEIHSAMFGNISSEPNTSGAEKETK